MSRNNSGQFEEHSNMNVIANANEPVFSSQSEGTVLPPHLHLANPSFEEDNVNTNEVAHTNDLPDRNTNPFQTNYHPQFAYQQSAQSQPHSHAHGHGHGHEHGNGHGNGNGNGNGYTHMHTHTHPHHSHSHSLPDGDLPSRSHSSISQYQYPNFPSSGNPFPSNAHNAAYTQQEEQQHHFVHKPELHSHSQDEGWQPFYLQAPQVPGHTQTQAQGIRTAHRTITYAPPETNNQPPTTPDSSLPKSPVVGQTITLRPVNAPDFAVELNEYEQSEHGHVQAQHGPQHQHEHQQYGGHPSYPQQHPLQAHGYAHAQALPPYQRQPYTPISAVTLNRDGPNDGTHVWNDSFPGRAPNPFGTSTATYPNTQSLLSAPLTMHALPPLYPSFGQGFTGVHQRQYSQQLVVEVGDEGVVDEIGTRPVSPASQSLRSPGSIRSSTPIRRAPDRSRAPAIFTRQDAANQQQITQKGHVSRWMHQPGGADAKTGMTTSETCSSSALSMDVISPGNGNPNLPYATYSHPLVHAQKHVHPHHQLSSHPYAFPNANIHSRPHSQGQGQSLPQIQANVASAPSSPGVATRAVKVGSRKKTTSLKLALRRTVTDPECGTGPGTMTGSATGTTQKTRSKPKPHSDPDVYAAVIAATTSKIAGPIPIVTLHKKHRGRQVVTSPDEIDANIVHVCPVPSCGACFRRREHVKRHIRGIHTLEKPHRCKYPECTGSFSRGDNLKAHYIACHKTTCDDIEAALLGKSSTLSQHPAFLALRSQ